MGCVVVRPARRLFGQATLPGDKSISHRYAILAALAEGTTRLGQFSPCLDCQSTLECLAALGIEIEQEGESVAISGRGARRAAVHVGADGRRLVAAPADGPHRDAAAANGSRNRSQPG